MDGGGINQEDSINRFTLLHIKQLNNKDLLYSTRDYIQYLIITYMGKGSEKEQMYMYGELNHFAVHLKLTQYCKSAMK